MSTRANEPMIGTSWEFSAAPLRTTSRGTTPIANRPAARTRMGTVKPAISPASTSGSCRRIDAISADIIERARRNDILRVTGEI